MAQDPDSSRGALEDSLSALASPPPRRGRIGVLILVVAIIALGAGAYYYFYLRGGDQPAAEVAEGGKGKGKGKKPSKKSSKKKAAERRSGAQAIIPDVDGVGAM